MRTTLTLDADVYREAQALARRALEKPAPEIVINPVSDLPQFAATKGSTIIRAAEIQKYLDKEAWF